MCLFKIIQCNFLPCFSIILEVLLAYLSIDNGVLEDDDDNNKNKFMQPYTNSRSYHELLVPVCGKLLVI